MANNGGRQGGGGNGQMNEHVEFTVKVRADISYVTTFILPFAMPGELGENWDFAPRLSGGSFSA